MLGAMGITFHKSSPKGQAELETLSHGYDAVICACGKAAVFPVKADGWLKDNIFAAGTCIKNQKVQTALQAMASGSRAANGVHAFLTCPSTEHGDAVTANIPAGTAAQSASAPFMMPVVPAGNGFTADEASAEAARCLHCGRAD